ncbi:MAG: terpene cyclase/mutase family protein [Armatimonadota bacterium]|nr:terpene cyclase/mutase family protein [Armatimonadota bacterium]MDR5696349.1 terpene cyclase/mutase family protein [Armatimonadota bacterium]
MYLARAIAFLENSANDLEQARVAGILGRAGPDGKVVRQIASRQNDDGGFPYEMQPGRASAIHTTCTVLDWMHDLGILDSPQAERVQTYLLAMQRPDGAWSETPGILKHRPPPFLHPADRAARAHCTALAGLWVRRLVGDADYAVTLAATYLRAHWDDEGRWGRFPSTLWLVAAFFANLDGGDEIAARALERLQAWVQDATAGQLAWMAGTLGLAGYGLHHPLLRAAAIRLLEMQEPDGGWPSDGGVLHRVEVTIRSLRALTGLGVPSAMS